MKMYHATNFKNLDSILEKGILKGPDGIVYLTTKPEDAIKFLAIRGIKEILVVQVEIPKINLFEQFDHDEKFFRCKAYGYPGDITLDKTGNFIKYEL